MLFGLCAGRGVVRDYSRRGQRACDAGTPLQVCGRRTHCEPHPEQPGAAVARKRTRRDGRSERCDNECAGRIYTGAWRCRRRDVLRGGQRNLFVSPAPRTDDPRITRVVGRALLGAARHRRAPPDRWLLDRPTGPISVGASDCIRTRVRVVATHQRRCRARAQGHTMTIRMADDTQRTAARVVGAAYLIALVSAAFAELYVRGQLVVAGNAAHTALNIVAHERLFRLGIASNLAVFAIDIALITALYVVLNPINRSLALLALGWGLVETAILVVATLRDFNVLRILSGAENLNVFELDRLQTLARLSVGTHADVYNVGLVFAGLRSTTFCYLWFKSGFIPRALAGFGVVASFLMGVSAYSFIIFSELAAIIPVGIYGGPIFFF